MIPSLQSEEEMRSQTFEVRGQPATDLWNRYKTAGPGDSSEEELVKRYLPLVKTVVGRMAISLPPHVDLQDLQSAGLIGLLNAVRQYNPALGSPFEIYARTRIRGAVLDHLRQMDWIPRSVHAKARRIQAVMQELEQASGEIPSDAAVAAVLKITPEEYERWLEEIRPTTFISLDAVTTSPEAEEDLSEHETFADAAQEDPADRVSKNELAKVISERITQLPELQRKVLALYYFEDMRLNEIAQAFGFCNSHICQIHAKAILAIRVYLERYEARRKPLTYPRT
jgi:RNA polymerase sigma factor for flagellar operon FliA